MTPDRNKRTETPPAWGVGDDALQGEEAQLYRTEHDAGSDAEAPSPITSTSTWMVVGIVALVAFAAILAYSVVVAPS